MPTVKCLNCGRPYPEHGAPYACPACGGLYDYAEPFALSETPVSAPGIWRDAMALGVITEPLSLGEGQTPLLPAKVLGGEVFFKCEYQNPSASFKDRGSATLVSFLRSRGVTQAVEDSSGNAGASFAAYARQRSQARQRAQPKAEIPVCRTCTLRLGTESARKPVGRARRTFATRNSVTMVQKERSFSARVKARA